MPGEFDDLQGMDQEVNQQDLERQAKALGWVPEEKFKGPKDKWISADEFLKKGEQVVPILRANNERMKGELLTRDARIDTLTQQLADAQKAIERLDEHYSAANKRAVDQALNDLKSQLKQAREDNDVDAEMEILGKIGDANEAKRNAEAGSTKSKQEDKKGDQQEQSDLHPDFQAWQKENSWFGGTSQADKKRTRAIMRIAEDLRDEGDDEVGRAFMDRCLAKLEEQEGSREDNEPPSRPSSKVEGAPRNGGGGRVKGWGDLPAEAKNACMADVDTFVGPNKRYKTEDEWKKQYVKIYFAQD